MLIVLNLFKILESKIDHNFHSLIPKEDLKPSIATSMLQTEKKKDYHVRFGLRKLINENVCQSHRD